MNASPKNTTLEFKVACAGIRAHTAARRRAMAGAQGAGDAGLRRGRVSLECVAWSVE